MTRSITHVIFDYGGAIIDIAAVIEQILAKHALDYNRATFRLIKDRLREASSFTEICEEINRHFDLKVEGNTTYKDLDVVKKNVLKWISESSIPMLSGAQTLISCLYENNIPMAIATNLDSRVFETLIDRTVDFQEKYFSHIVCGADIEVRANKPAPDLYLVCAKRFNPPPESLDSCVIFERSLKGITGAVATGMKTVVVTDKTVIELGAVADKMTRIISSYTKFCPESVGLPSFE